MIRSRARLDRLIALQAPEVFVANECELLACVAASILPDGSSIEPRDATYERTSASGADERALSGPDLWHLLDDVARWTRDPFAANRGLGTALERLPHHAAFVAAHAEVWPSDMTFWQVHAYEPDPAWAARAQDVYTDRALWRPAAVCFTDDALPPDDAWHPDVRALFRAGERVGVGESGGPLTVASGPALAAHARRLRELAADAGAAAPWVDAVRALAERCDEAAARGATWVCYVQLDAPPP